MEIKPKHLYLIKYEQRMKNARTGEYFDVKEFLVGFFNVGAEEDEKYFEGMCFGKTIGGGVYGDTTYIERCEYNEKECTILQDLGEII